MPPVKLANLALRFLLELCGLAALGYWGFQATTNAFVNALLGIGAPMFAAVVWGAFVAPKAARRTHDPVRLVIELAVFGAATAALYGAKQPALGLALPVAYAVNRALIMMWRQEKY